MVWGDEPKGRKSPLRRLWVVSLDSTREVDREGRRVRRLEGVNQPTEHEGDGRWRHYEVLRPDPILPGEPLTIGWEDVGDHWRATVTSQVVGAFFADTTRGPYGWSGGPEEANEKTSGVVYVEGTEVLTPTASAAHVVSNLANAGAAYEGFSAPEPLWQLLPVRDGCSGERLAIGVACVPVALGDRDAVEHLYDALVRLPPDVNLPAGVLAAAEAAGWSGPLRVTTVPPAYQRIALAAAGLTDDEVEGVANFAVLIDAVGDLADLMPMGSVGRWLRSPHPALDGATPLEALRSGRRLAPALAAPFPGGVLEYEWEPEAVRCYEAALVAGWSQQNLRRDKADGRWLLVGSYKGVKVAVSDGLDGVVVAAQIGDRDAPCDGIVTLDGAFEPETAPGFVAELVGSWLAEPGHAELALARALRRMGEQ